MPKLDNKIFQKIKILNDKAEILIHNEQFSEAIKEYQKAWNTLPEPRQLWEAGLWIKISQAECCLATGDYEMGKQKLLEAMLCSGAVNNPLVHLLLGICCYETADEKCARVELQLAYQLQGETIFQEGDEKYRDFLNIGKIQLS